MATITIKGNTSKTKKFFPATEEKAAMLCFDVADHVIKSDKSKLDVWYRCVVQREYAETVYRLMHGENEVSRKVTVTGRITSAPRVYVDKSGQTHTEITVWVNGPDGVDFRDDNWPEREIEGEPNLNDAPADPEPVGDGDLPF